MPDRVRLAFETDFSVMRSAILVMSILWVACQRTPPTDTATGTIQPHARPPSKMTPQRQRKLDANMALLWSEHSDWKSGAAWLVAHPRVSRGALVDLVRDAIDGGHVQARLMLAGPRALDVLAKIGNPDDVPILADFMIVAFDAGWTAGWDAAQALANHPSVEAEKALREALTHANPKVVDAAADALRVRESAP